MEHLFALSGDIFAFILIWKSRKLVLQKQQKMFETETDFRMRKVGGYILILLSLVAIFANHFLFKF